MATSGACNGTSTSTTVAINFGVVTPALTSTPQAGGGVLTTPALTGITYQFFRNGVAVAAAGTNNTLLLSRWARRTAATPWS